MQRKRKFSLSSEKLESRVLMTASPGYYDHLPFVWDRVSPDSVPVATVTASGDFNNDGFDDMAIGGDNQVAIIYGSRDAPGLDPYFGYHVIDQDTPGVEGDKEAGDGFGYSLATGDFNGDRYDDLAVGVPFEGLDGRDHVGVVQIFYGSGTGDHGSR